VNTTATQPARFLEWDSTFFARRIASVANAALRPEDVVSVVDWCRADRIECVYVLPDSEDVPAMHALEDAGARLVDVRMMFDRKLEATAGATPSTVRPSRPSDVPALRTIAGQSHSNSRFYADPHFPRARCDELYATWIEKSCRGWADRVFVAEHENRPVGYLSCHVREEGRGEIGIVGVAPEAQGHGLGRDLVVSALRFFAEQGLSRVTVVTQGRNIVAQRLYESMGFRTSSVKCWHHLWLEVDPR
jgi:dTDP-4-amino-4,6-dideoxy-D-galactose acyltransferase